jgi:hypothetical protein
MVSEDVLADVAGTIAAALVGQIRPTHLQPPGEAEAVGKLAVRITRAIIEALREESI